MLSDLFNFAASPFHEVFKDIGNSVQTDVGAIAGVVAVSWKVVVYQFQLIFQVFDYGFVLKN